MPRDNFTDANYDRKLAEYKAMKAKLLAEGNHPAQKISLP